MEITKFYVFIHFSSSLTIYLQNDQLGAYVNTVVVQHDDDLIFPGDLAFDLRCHNQVTVNASFAG